MNSVMMVHFEFPDDTLSENNGLADSLTTS